MSMSDVIDHASTVIDKVVEVVKKYIPDEATRNSFLADLDISSTKAQFELDKMQVQMNMDATKSPKWRDWLAKGCVVAIMYHVFLHPVAMQIGLAVGHPIQVYNFDIAQLNQLIYALLGLAGFETAPGVVKSFLKTQENINATNSNNPK